MNDTQFDKTKYVHTNTPVRLPIFHILILWQQQQNASQEKRKEVSWFFFFKLVWMFLWFLGTLFSFAMFSFHFIIFYSAFALHPHALCVSRNAKCHIEIWFASGNSPQKHTAMPIQSNQKSTKVHFRMLFNVRILNQSLNLNNQSSDFLSIPSSSIIIKKILLTDEQW